MARTYWVSEWSYKDDYNVDKALRGKVSRYVVTDENKDETEEQRPAVATFKVNVLYDAESQKIRANRLAAYLNEVNSKINMYQTLSSTDITS